MAVQRRQFIKAVAAGAIVGGVQIRGAPAVHAQSKAKTYRTALVGSGWWGMNILREAMAAGNAKCVGLCDVDQDRLEIAAEEVNDLSGDLPKIYTDFRELLDKERLDIVIVATPDHWHALNTISAIEKGAHIYVEKPTGHTIGESRAMLRAARANDRTVQVGLHRRIGPHYVSGMKFLKDGGAGDIGMVRMFVQSRGGAERPTRNSEPPEQLD
jgi:predicted dehydrogenase